MYVQKKLIKGKLCGNFDSRLKALLERDEI